MMALKPQDVVVLLRLLSSEGDRTYPRLALALGMSSSEVHASVRRAAKAGLVRLDDREPNRQALLEFLVHGVKYAFPAERGGITRGMRTAHAAAPLAKKFAAGNEPPPVWPDPEGDVRGEALEPLYRSVPGAARADAELYEWLALVDAIRVGRARERELATKELQRRLS
ncbi:MAG TPA: winged helix-turn-helix domain-containing protein [Polyangiaceae bacterium]|jgi:DNA-binding Lrp family transcriptional regulator